MNREARKTREIKFRAWYKDGTEGMIYLSLDGFLDPLQEFEGGIGGYEIMQYTGLKDKNGKEIYEGDIIVSDYEKWWHNQPCGVVEYLENGFWLSGKDGSHFMPNEDSRRVIGNIYENPELLESKGGK